MIKKELRDLIAALTRKVVACPIPVRWRTTGPRTGERGGKRPGPRRYEIVMRKEYEHGDDPRDIDWIATAQLGGQNILVAQDLDPRQIDVFALIDLKPTMDFGTTGTTKRMLAAELAGSLVKSAGKTGDRVGWRIYAQHALIRRQRPSSSRSMLHNIIADTASIDASDDRESGSGLIESLSSLPSQQSLVFIFSDFIALTENEKRALRRASARHEVVCVVLEDERERSLPEGMGLYRLEDLLTGRCQTIWLSTKSRTQYSANFERHRAALLADLKAAHCHTSVFSTASSTADDTSAMTEMIRLFGSHRR